MKTLCYWSKAAGRVMWVVGVPHQRGICNRKQLLAPQQLSTEHDEGAGAAAGGCLCWSAAGELHCSEVLWMATAKPCSTSCELLWEHVLYDGGWGTDLVGCCRVSVVLLAPTNLSQILQDFFTQGGVSCLEGLLAGCLKALGALMES